MYEDDPVPTWFKVAIVIAIVFIVGVAFASIHMAHARDKQCRDTFGSGYIYRNASNGPDCIGKQGDGKYLQNVVWW